jgi:hypothetical protein
VSFGRACRCVSDVLSVGRHGYHSYVHLIYPDGLEINDTTKSDNSASYLDILLNIDSNGRQTSTRHGKRGYFDFAIVGFPFLWSDIPLSSACGVCLPVGLVRRNVFCVLDLSGLLAERLMLQGCDESCFGVIISQILRSLQWPCWRLQIITGSCAKGFVSCPLLHVRCCSRASFDDVWYHVPGFDKGRTVDVFSADDAYSSMAPDPTLAFVGGTCCLTLDFVFAFWIMIRFDTLLTSLFCIGNYCRLLCNFNVLEYTWNFKSKSLEFMVIHVYQTSFYYDVE